MRLPRLDCRYLLVGMVSILLLGLSLRTVHLGSSSFWLDEVHSYERASQRSWQAMYEILRRKNHAPLYALLLHHWLEIGTSEFVLRYLTVLLGVMTIAITYALGRELGTQLEAVLSGFIVAASPLHVYYSREARMYVLAGLLVTSSLYCLHKVTRSERARYWHGYVLCATLSLYTHYYSALTFIVTGAFVVTKTVIESDWRLLRCLIIAHVSVTLLFAPWLPTFLFQLLHNDPLPWLSRPTWGFLHRTIARFYIHDTVLGVAYPAFAWALVLVLAFPLLSLVNEKRRLPLEPRRDSLFTALCAIGPVTLAVGISLVIKPIFFDRYFVLTAPIASIFLAQGVVRSVQFRWPIPVVCFVAVGILVSTHGVTTTQWKEDWRTAALVVRQDLGPQDILVFGTGMHIPPFNHYYDGHQALGQYGLPTDWDDRHEAVETLDQAAFGRFWTVRTERFNGCDRVLDYVVSRYADRLVSCSSFGGWYAADVCLYTRR